MIVCLSCSFIAVQSTHINANGCYLFVQPHQSLLMVIIEIMRVMRKNIHRMHGMSHVYQRRCIGSCLDKVTGSCALIERGRQVQELFCNGIVEHVQYFLDKIKVMINNNHVLVS